MKIKTILVYFGVFTAIFIVSECANYFFNASSPSSVVLNTFFINKSINEAKKSKLDSAMYYLSIASQINIIGEYGLNFKNLPSNYIDQIKFTTDGDFENVLLSYLASLSPRDLSNDEDQGLAWIYYNLGLLAYKNSQPDLVSSFFKMAVYNYPEFPSFHGELINYYYVQGNSVDADQSLVYCRKFKNPAAFCGKIKEDFINFKTAKVVGFMEKPVKKHYLKE